jgi:hypothetical protein
MSLRDLFGRREQVPVLPPPSDRPFSELNRAECRWLEEELRSAAAARDAAADRLTSQGTEPHQAWSAFLAADERLRTRYVQRHGEAKASDDLPPAPRLAAPPNDVSSFSSLSRARRLTPT